MRGTQARTRGATSRPRARRRRSSPPPPRRAPTRARLARTLECVRARAGLVERAWAGSGGVRRLGVGGQGGLGAGLGEVWCATSARGCAPPDHEEIIGIIWRGFGVPVFNTQFQYSISILSFSTSVSPTRHAASSRGCALPAARAPPCFYLVALPFLVFSGRGPCLQPRTAPCGPHRSRSERAEIRRRDRVWRGAGAGRLRRVWAEGRGAWAGRSL